MDLKALKGFMFDLDGVVWAGQTLLPGAAEFVAALRDAGRRVLFVSNNSAATAQSLAQRLTAFGITTQPSEVISPIGVAGEHLTARYGRLRVLVSGVPALSHALAEAGHTPVTDPEAAEAVIMGRDPHFGFEMLIRVCRAVDRGVPFLVMNRDLRLPIEGGAWLPGLGATVAAVVAAAGREPEIVGKPSPLLFETGLKHLGLQPSEAVMVGDSPHADIAGGLAAGMWTVLVGGAHNEPPAHLVVENVAELMHLWL